MFAISVMLRNLVALFPFSKRSQDFDSLVAGVHPFHNEADFRRLIRQETARCMRRPRRHEFAIVQIAVLGELKSFLKQTNAALRELRRRARITDEFGWWDGHLAILLPETGREGSLYVMNRIEEEFGRRAIPIELSLFVYPWDDLISRRSGELDSIENDSSEQIDALIIDPPSGDGNAPVGSFNQPPHFLNGGERQANALLTEPEIKTSEVKSIGIAPIKPIKNIERVFSQGTPWWKRTIDLLGATILLIVLFPLMLIVAWLIRRDSPGPALFTQLREGKDGQTFKIYKFRTMMVGAEQQQSLLREQSEQDGPAFKIGNDPRVTKLGRLLRKSCIDELPQLINVLRGEMSLVGPRPLPVRESTQCKMWHRQRLQVLPGLTCIWQVFGGRAVSFERWMRMDLEYLEKRSFWFDLKLIAWTAWKVIRQKGSV